MKTQVIVVAAGLGTRLNARMPKALVKLKGKPLLWHCLNVFEHHAGIEGIIVVGVDNFLPDFAQSMRGFKKVRALVAGGAVRRDSVRRGLDALAVDTHMVLVHDAARPCVDFATIDRVIEALKKHKAAIAGVPVKATIKKVCRQTLNIQETLPRDLLWEAQTPQGFHKSILIKAHAGMLTQEVTDDAMMVECMGFKVKMVMGDYRNIKVTTPEDMIVAKQLLNT